MRYEWYVLGFAMLPLLGNYDDRTSNGRERNGKHTQDRSDLAISYDSARKTAAIWPHKIVIQNLGAVGATGRLRVAILDSGGVVLPGGALTMEVVLPAANLGGLRGRVVSLLGNARFSALVDRLMMSGERFGIHASITSAEPEVNNWNNQGFREWGAWQPIFPNTVTKFRFDTSLFSTQGANKVAEIVQRPWGTLVFAGNEPVQGFYSDAPVDELAIHTPSHLAHGEMLLVRLLHQDRSNQRILYQSERFAVYDTLPPLLHSYRAVLMRNNIVAIQVGGSDRHAGVAESGVSTFVSLNKGRTWQRFTHSYVYDAFDNPSIFEVLVGPFKSGDTVMFGVEMVDRVGNATTDVPQDAILIWSPLGSAESLERLNFSGTQGNPIFAPDVVDHILTNASAARAIAPIRNRNLRTHLLKHDAKAKREIDAMYGSWMPLGRKSSTFEQLATYRLRKIRAGTISQVLQLVVP